jgi:hypothetical protein
VKSHEPELLLQLLVGCGGLAVLARKWLVSSYPSRDTSSANNTLSRSAGVRCGPRIILWPALVCYSRHIRILFALRNRRISFLVEVKRRHLACCLTSAENALLGCGTFFDRCVSVWSTAVFTVTTFTKNLYNDFPTRLRRNLIKGQLMSLKIPQRPAKHREPSELHSPSL